MAGLGGQGGGGPLDQVLGPMAWLLDTSGPDGGRGIGLSSGTEVLSPLEAEEVAGDTEAGLPRLVRPFSVSVLCLALTIPTGIAPETPGESARLERCRRETSLTD